jgi:HEAT repeat protein
MTSLKPDQRILEWLVRDLASADLEIRETSLDRLGSLSGDHTGLIAGMLADPDPEVRGSAAANLGGVRRANAWPPLVRAARNESSDEVLCHIVGALARYHDQLILETLLDLLAQRDREYLIRMEIAVQLWKYEPAVVIPKLVEIALGDDNDLVRSSAADSLELLEEISPSDPARHDIWLQLADDSDPGVANVATRALHQESAPRVVDVLAAISRRLQHPTADERSFALYRLSLLAPASARRRARPMLNDEHPGVRVACCSCLGAIHDDAAIPLLLTALRTDLESRVQTSALLGLENYHTAEIGEALLEVLETGTLAGNSLSILCRQLWKYPSNRTVLLLQRVLASSVKLPHRPAVESTLAFLLRFASPDSL